MKFCSFKKVIRNYEYVFLDQWGVIHDGNFKYCYTNKVLNNFKKKKIIAISNTSQTKLNYINQTLKKLKINHKIFYKIITSGEILLYIKKKKNLKFKKFRKISNLFCKRNAFLISNDNDKKILKKLDVLNTNCKEAKFILALSLPKILDIVLLKKKLRILKKRKIEMVCANPDMSFFDTETKSTKYQIGFFANYYKKLGGKVIFIGKPETDVIRLYFNKKQLRKSIIVGDTLKTDIRLAQKLKIKSVLCYDGYKKNEKKLYQNKNILKKIIPSYIVKNIST